jgi:hypothetical protein
VVRVAWHHETRTTLYDLRFKQGVALRTTGGASGDIGTALGTFEGELRATHGALNGVIARSRSAFGTDGLIAVGTAIRAIG